MPNKPNFYYCDLRDDETREMSGPRFVHIHPMANAHDVLTAIRYHENDQEYQRKILINVLSDPAQYPDLHSQAKAFNGKKAVTYYMCQLAAELPAHCLSTMHAAMRDKQLYRDGYSAMLEGLKSRTDGITSLKKLPQSDSRTATERYRKKISGMNTKALSKELITLLTNINKYKQYLPVFLDVLRYRKITHLDLSRESSSNVISADADWDAQVIPGLKQVLTVLIENNLDADNNEEGSPTQLPLDIGELLTLVENQCVDRSTLWLNKPRVASGYLALEKQLLGIHIPASKQELINSYKGYTPALSWQAFRFLFLPRNSIASEIGTRQLSHSDGASDKTDSYWDRLLYLPVSSTSPGVHFA